MKLIFDNKKVFDYSKPIDLISDILLKGVDKDSIILDSFAGSGTTAHAVLNLNKRDGGNRQFILIEMEDYAETITAERVRRVIHGYGEGKNAVEGTGGSFTYYELGEQLMIDGNLNPHLPIEEIHAYIWYCETHTQYTKPDTLHTYCLGRHNDTDYYFYYEADRPTTLNMEFLATIHQPAEQYIIYADNCVLPADFMATHHIVFKKIPRDIKTF